MGDREYNLGKTAGFELVIDAEHEHRQDKHHQRKACDGANSLQRSLHVYIIDQYGGSKNWLIVNNH